MRTANVALFVASLLAFLWMINSGQQHNNTALTSEQRSTKSEADAAEQSLATIGDTSSPEGLVGSTVYFSRGGTICTNVDDLEKFAIMFQIDKDAWWRALKNNNLDRCRVAIGSRDTKGQVERTLRDAACIRGLASDAWPESKQQSCLWVAKSNLYKTPPY